MTVQLWLIFGLDWWFGFLKGIVTYGYPDSNPKPPITLQGTNISHQGKRKIIDSNMPYQWDMLISWRVTII